MEKFQNTRGLFGNLKIKLCAHFLEPNATYPFLDTLAVS